MRPSNDPDLHDSEPSISTSVDNMGYVTNHYLTRSILANVVQWMLGKSAPKAPPPTKGVDGLVLDLAPELKNRPCINDACTNLALKEVSKQPKAAYSTECFRIWKKQANTIVFISACPITPSKVPSPALLQARTLGGPELAPREVQKGSLFLRS
eukprot:2276998-Rhodomonas_salina.4